MIKWTLLSVLWWSLSGFPAQAQDAPELITPEPVERPTSTVPATFTFEAIEKAFRRGLKPQGADLDHRTYLLIGAATDSRRLLKRPIQPYLATQYDLAGLKDSNQQTRTLSFRLEENFLTEENAPLLQAKISGDPQELWADEEADSQSIQFKRGPGSFIALYTCRSLDRNGEKLICGLSMQVNPGKLGESEKRLDIAAQYLKCDGTIFSYLAFKRMAKKTDRPRSHAHGL